VASFLGETLGFLAPVLAFVIGVDDGDGTTRFLALVTAGAVEGAVLGAAQGVVLRRVLPGFQQVAWTVRTALAAALAWAVGLLPSALAGSRQAWPTIAVLALAVPAGLVLLTSIGIAQWTVLRRSVPAAARWIGWTALAWLAGLTVFMVVATPLWQPDQPTWLTAAIGALAGALMALTMASVTGWGLTRLLPTYTSTSGPAGPGATANRTSERSSR
jgi:Ca2+-transporting ATPase